MGGFSYIIQSFNKKYTIFIVKKEINEKNGENGNFVIASWGLSKSQYKAY